jgi:hypothetical protein
MSGWISYIHMRECTAEMPEAFAGGDLATSCVKRLPHSRRLYLSDRLCTNPQISVVLRY